MKKQNKNYLYFIKIKRKVFQFSRVVNVILFVLIFSSCDKNIINNSNSNIEKGKVAVEIFSHSQSVSKIEFLNDTEYSDFISPEVISMISSNKQAIMRMRENRTTEIDTVFSLEEIPIYTERITSTHIYSSGIMESVTQDVTPDDKNPINTFTANPLPVEFKIKKTIVEDGMIKSFNGDGKLIQSKPYAQQDMKVFLDTLKYYIALSEKVGEPQRAKLETQLSKIKKQTIPSGAKIIELSNGNIVLEQPIDNRVSTNGLRLKSNSEPLRARTELNPEMNKTIKFEVLKGKQLLERRTYFYSNKETLKNSKYTLNLPNENPEIIKSEILTFNSQGIPMIKCIQELYIRNQMIFHF